MSEVMDRWIRRLRRGAEHRLGPRIAGAAALLLLGLTASLAVLLTVLSHRAWLQVLVSIIVSLPVLFVAWLAVPGVVRPQVPVHGRPVRRWTPLDLGVHPVIDGGPMPGYIWRAHDRLLRDVLDPAVPGSRLVVIRGGSSTGKTRAAYEAVVRRLADWQLDYPLDPGTLAARLTEGIPPRTVLWLGELRQYVDADGGQAALARLADLLDGKSHSVVITTVWPQHWDLYLEATHAGRDGADAAGTAGRLLTRLPVLTGSDPALVDAAAGGVIDVSERFTSEELEAVAKAGDKVLAHAAEAAKGAGQDGQVTQYLAGVPDLLRRYSAAGGNPYGQAMITAAMDAARLGHVGPLSAELLQEAAVGYLSEPQRTRDIPLWRDAALDWAAEELRGAVRALRPIPPVTGTGVAGYQIADYLDQHGRRVRQDQIGPCSLWEALSARTSAASDLTRLGQAAFRRGLYRYAAVLWTRAVGMGSSDAAARLIGQLLEGSPDDVMGAARWVAASVAPDHPREIVRLLREIKDAGADDAVATLGARAADTVSLHSGGYVSELLYLLYDVGLHDAVRTLGERAASQVSTDREDPGHLLATLHEVGLSDAFCALAERLTGQISFDDPWDIAQLLKALHRSGASGAAREPAERAAVQFSPAEPRAAARLLDVLREAGATSAVRTFAGRAAAQACLTYPHRVAELLEALNHANASDAIATLAVRAVDDVNVEVLYHVSDLLHALDEIGADELVSLLVTKAATGVSIDEPRTVAGMLSLLHGVRASDAIGTLLGRDVAQRVVLDDPGVVAELIVGLGQVGASNAILTLLDRQPADQVSLTDPKGIVKLLLVLRDVDAGDAIQSLADRISDYLRHDGDVAIAWLNDALKQAEMSPAVRALELGTTHRFSFGDPRDAAWLVRILRDARRGDVIQAVADGADLDDPGSIAALLGRLRTAGATDAVRSLAGRAGEQATMDYDTQSAARLLTALHAADADHAVAVLAPRVVTRASLDDPADVAALLEALRAAKASDAVRCLLDRGPAAHVSLRRAARVADLVQALHSAGARDEVTLLADRAAASASLADPGEAAYVLTKLHKADAGDAITTIAARAAAEVKLDRHRDIERLMATMQDAHTGGAIRILADRVACAGMFDLYLKANPAMASTYAFGREPDGAATKSWTWQEYQTS